jgi:ATP-dependent helicase/nuclease subunit A
MRQKRARPKPLSAGTAKISNEAQQLLGRVRESLNWKYPFDDLTKLSAKTSVSKLTHPADEFAPADLSDAFDRRPGAVSPDKTDNKLIGTATHLVIQNLALNRDITIDSIQATAEKLASEDKISPKMAGRIDCDSILKFFLSDLGKLVTEHKDNILREWPFTFASDATQLGAISPGETVIVQGIIDMIIKTPAGLVIIDFKTDDVTAEFAAQYAQHRNYYDQMQHYATAASEILNQEIKESWLYFLKPAIAINVPRPSDIC